MKRFFINSIIFVLVFTSCTKKQNDVKFEKDGNFYVYVMLNDSIKGRFIFDTGADGLYLDSTFVKLHGSLIKSNLDTARMGGAGATELKQVYLIKDPIKVNIGSYNHKFTNSPILKLADFNGDNVAGIIGNEFIKNQVLVIDNENLKLKIDTIVNPKEYEAILPFEYIDGRIYLKANLEIKDNHRITARLLFDLGSPDGITLNSYYYKSLKRKNIRPLKVIDYTILFGGALGGNSDGGEFRATSINLGIDKIKNPIISFSKDTLGALSNKDYDGLIGNEILDRYNYAIDYRNHKLYLNKNGKYKKPFKSTLTGFYAMKKKDYAVVMSIYYQSDAFKNGVQLGDSIVLINNKKVTDLSDKELQEELKGEGKAIKLTIVRNKKRIKSIFVQNYLLW